MNRRWQSNPPAPRNRRPATPRMRSLLLLMLTTMSGCLIAEDHLTLNGDGSGTVTMRTTVLGPQKWTEGKRQAVGMLPYYQTETAAYPPMTEKDAAALFAGTGIQTHLTHEKDNAGRDVAVTTVTFSDINPLMRSVYGRVHQLTVTQLGGVLTVRARSGIEGLLCAAKMVRDHGDPPEQAPDDAGPMKREAGTGQLRCTFAITLPGKAAATQADAVDGATAIWIVDRGKAGDDARTWAAASRELQADCPADSVTFKPDSPQRLALTDFAQLMEKQLGGDMPVVPVTTIQQQAQWVPVRLSVTRTFSFSGDTYGENQSQLYLGLSIPAAYKPMGWGAIQATEAVDDLGNSLLPDNDDEHDRYSQVSMFNQMNAPEPKADAPSQNLYVLTLRAMTGKAKSLRKVAGTVALEYPGDRHLMKIADAVKITSMDGERQSEAPSDAGRISHPLLSRLGVTLESPTAWCRNGATGVLLHYQGLIEFEQVQVFDHAGRPWPTLMMNRPEYDTGRYVQVMVPGEPEGPLSMAMIVRGGGTRVELPFEMKDLPIEPNDAKEPPDTPDTPDAPDAVRETF